MRAIALAFACGAVLFSSVGAIAQLAGDVTRNPLPPMVARSLQDSITAQLLEPEKAEVRVIVHFPAGRGENGRICGEVVESLDDGPSVRTFYATYTRAGRVLARFENMPFEEFLERDTVFRNCRPRL